MSPSRDDLAAGLGRWREVADHAKQAAADAIARREKEREQQSTEAPPAPAKEGA